MATNPSMPERSFAYMHAELAYLRAADEPHASLDVLLAEEPEFLTGWL